MSTAIPLAPTRRIDTVTLLKAWLILGVVDAFCAVAETLWIFHSGTAAGVWRGVASAAVGPSARTGGSDMVALGLFFHFCVALGWTLGYYLVYSNWTQLRRFSAGAFGAFRVGIPYGAIVWLSMAYIVFPLTTIGHVAHLTESYAVNLVQHMLVIGPIIVWFVKPRTTD